MYFHGLGVERDVARAWKYFERARYEDKDNQNNDVLFNLGLVRKKRWCWGMRGLERVVASARRLTLAMPQPVEHVHVVSTCTGAATTKLVEY